MWPDSAELLFSKAIAEYDRQSALSSNASSPYPPDLPSRNEFIVRYLKDRGLDRSKQQVASHIQQLKKRSSKELAVNGGGSSNGSSPIASPSTLASPGWINPYTGMTSPTTNAQPFYHPQQQQHYSLPSSPSYNHRSPISPSSSSHYSNSASPYSHPSPVPSSTSAVTSLQIRVNNSQGIQIPLTPSSSTSGQGITVTTVSPSSVKIRLLVPPHSSPLAHLQNANIYAVIGVRSDVFSRLTGRMIGNRIWADGRALGEETDLFEVKSSSSPSSSSVQVVAPLRLTGGMLLGQNVGVLTIQQTIYGPPQTSSYPSSTSSSALLTINYELVHAAHPSLPQQQPSYGMSYGGMGGGAGYSNGSLGSAWVSNASAATGPFTQF